MQLIDPDTHNTYTLSMNYKGSMTYNAIKHIMQSPGTKTKKSSTDPHHPKKNKHYN